tara:strand:+ start:1387 stop:2280 length:894 start_codon:yes stop_codon:yes gene_type:complete
MRFVVTGGRGFIGSHFVEEALRMGHSVVDIDKITYCAHSNLPWDNHKNYKLIKQDITELKHLPSCDVLINFAAESHVDNSINETAPFVRSNILGVHNLLELVRGKKEYDRPLFFQISTDEVYGDSLEKYFAEEDRLNPSNPYSASKAAAEMLVLSYNKTYGMDYVITRSTNNYGERQYHEKLIPKIQDCIKHSRKVPIHGTGEYVRDWLYVKDNIDALFTIIDRKITNEILNIGANNHLQNLEVVDTVLGWHSLTPLNMVQFVENRWGQDIKYAVDCTKMEKLGWKPKYNNGLHRWY